MIILASPGGPGTYGPVFFRRDSRRMGVVLFGREKAWFRVARANSFARGVLKGQAPLRQPVGWAWSPCGRFGNRRSTRTNALWEFERHCPWVAAYCDRTGFSGVRLVFMAALLLVMSSEAQRSRDIWHREPCVYRSRPDPSTSLGVTKTHISARRYGRTPFLRLGDKRFTIRLFTVRIWPRGIEMKEGGT